MDARTIYEELVAAEDSPVRYEWHGQALKMAGHANPISITWPEFDLIRRVVQRNGLKAGFEVATGFGISALAAGLVMIETKGWLVTMDAYVEEQLNDYRAYRANLAHDLPPALFPESDGLRSVEYLVKRYRVPVIPIVGWSPHDTAQTIQSIRQRVDYVLIDYVLIDGGHWAEQAIADVEAIEPALSRERFVLFVHDVDLLGVDWQAYCVGRFGQRCQVLEGMRPPMGFNLGAIAKGVELA